ncbi:hypothetical protein BPI_II726 [Brucella pinnipedialis B2/94]|uniref:Probable membrane transporter protein n=2 Tax=Brucella pinnipedialis TaxID=120576 RepID=A0A0E1WYG7_9HYPH|nr:hypothetical protein BPI_II726 [Brucella pinnipedialis B2/94]EEY01379.1 conserved hypothetical protein [Brucella pinnipedialis B2/94]EEZ28916.1 conserved hypothetical protein [Brucella pinnipedialis M292/94/1]
MIEHTPLFLTVAVIAAFLVGLSKGGLPTVGTLSVPLMALVISPVTAAALLLPIYVVSDMFGLYLYRHHFSARNLAILTPSAIVGVGIGWLFSSHLSSTFIGMLVGLVGLLFCFNAWVGARYRKKNAQGRYSGRHFLGHTDRPYKFCFPFRRTAIPDVCAAATSGKARLCRHIHHSLCHCKCSEACTLLGTEPVFQSRSLAWPLAGSGSGDRHLRRRNIHTDHARRAFLPAGPAHPFRLSIKLVADWIVPFFFA